MADDNQNIHNQSMLLQIVSTQAATNIILENLAKDIKKNDERTQQDLKDLSDKIVANSTKTNELEKEIKDITDKAKYWKGALCLVIGAGGIVVSIIQFGNEVAVFIKHFFNVRGQ